jgi:hypothetical protein
MGIRVLCARCRYPEWYEGEFSSLGSYELTASRWHLQLLFPTDQVLRLHLRAVSTVRHSWRCGRSRGFDRVWLSWRQIEEQDLSRDLRSSYRYHRNVLDCWAASTQQQWAPGRLLPDSSVTDAFCGFSVVDQFECCWVHEEGTLSSCDWKAPDKIADTSYPQTTVAALYLIGYCIGKYKNWPKILSNLLRPRF